MKKSYVGIDNGVSGSIGIIQPYAKAVFFETPIKEVFNYSGKRLNRIDVEELKRELSAYEMANMVVLLERPMVNPMRFDATASALRAFEATLIALEQLQISYQVVDSKKWQKEFLPNIKGSKDLKKASLQRGVERFPILEREIKKHGDADGLFLALYGSAHNL